MSFENTFLHTLSSQSVSVKGKTLADFLPPSISYSMQAAEHLIYLKAAGTTSFPANAHYTQQNFHSYLLIYSLSGSAILQYQDASYPIPAGSLLFIDCRREYTLHCSTPWKFQTLFFDGYPVPYYYDIYTQIALPVIRLPEVSLFPQLFTRIILQNFNHPELTNAKLLTEILTHLLCVCQDTYNDTGMPSWLIQLKETLDTGYAEHFSLDELSGRFHINKYQICRDFKKYLKTTPLQYINSIRLEHAKELLQNTSLQVNEISWRVGFENVNYFIQLFKRENGTTPALYRKKRIQ